MGISSVCWNQIPSISSSSPKECYAVTYSLFVIAVSGLSIVDGHDSLEDARACMELMKYRFTEDKKKDSRPNHVTTKSSSSFYTSKH